jgi:hypothetical protein
MMRSIDHVTQNPKCRNCQKGGVDIPSLISKIFNASGDEQDRVEREKSHCDWQRREEPDNSVATCRDGFPSKFGLDPGVGRNDQIGSDTDSIESNDTESLHLGVHGCLTLLMIRANEGAAPALQEA